MSYDKNMSTIPLGQEKVLDKMEQDEAVIFLGQAEISLTLLDTWIFKVLKKTCTSLIVAKSMPIFT